MFLPASVIGFTIFVNDADREDVDAKRDQEQHHAQGKGRKSLGIVKSGITDQQGNNLDGHGRHAV